MVKYLKSIISKTILLSSIFLLSFYMISFADIPSNRSNINNCIQKIITNKRLEDSLLKNLSQKELYLLRNSIYAKHEIIFKSKNLQNYFTNFNWYNPHNKTVVLTDIDKFNLKLITWYETENQLKKYISLSKHILNKNIFIIGLWHSSPVLASGWLVLPMVTP